LIVPEVVPETEPILTGAAKLPDASLSCKVKTLPAANVPVIVYEIFTDDPAQISVNPTEGIVMEANALTVML
jgi:hypothetical protein